MGKELSWKPQHRDRGVYCSPACGANCSLKEYDRAIKNAVRLNKELKEFGWEPHVHENLGWHYCIRKGENKIYQHGNECTAYIYLGGKQFVASGKTPKKALKAAISMAQSLARGITEDVVGLAL